MNGPKVSNEIANLLKTMIIIQLGLADVTQSNIRRIIGGDMNRINKILKNVKPKKPTKE